MVKTLVAFVVGAMLGPLTVNTLARFGASEAIQLLGLTVVCGGAGLLISALWPIRKSA